MRIILAIDIIGGKCVRLTRGDFNTKKIYNEDPLEVAKKIEEGYTPVGGHQVVTTLIQNVIRADSVIVRSQYSNEYSQTMKKG